MLNLGQLANTVQQNCHISDARHAGDYTLCIFLLKMREYYRWENGIPFSGEIPKDDVGVWLQEREQMWSHLETSGFEPLPLEHGTLDPFDAVAANRELVPQGYVYSAGYGRFCKPHFFLGQLASQQERDGHTVYIATCEYARDLVAPPAMQQNNVIYLRQESVRRFLWERIEEWGWNRKNDAMARALACYRFDEDREAALERMVENETESMILHELGEGIAGRLLGEQWEEMLAAFSPSKAEIMARAVRDLLADCASTLPALLETDNTAALHFYFANFTGMRQHLFPEARDAYRRWLEGGDRTPLQRAVTQGHVRWLETARTLLDLHRRSGSQAGAMVESLLEHGPM